MSRMGEGDITICKREESLIKRKNEGRKICLAILTRSIKFSCMKIEMTPLTYIDITPSPKKISKYIRRKKRDNEIRVTDVNREETNGRQNHPQEGLQQRISDGI